MTQHSGNHKNLGNSRRFNSIALNLSDFHGKSLDNLTKNQTGIVDHINAGSKATQRLTGLGITPGTEITMISSAPFGGPIQITLRGTKLAIGRGLARKINLRDFKGK
jgi:Fe2+ transport system protein FeoA